MQTNADMTIYNRVSGDVYQCTQIPHVVWDNRKAANTLKVGLVAADQASVYIQFCNPMASLYLEPKAWQALTSKTGYWTLQVGDYIVKELVTDEIHTAIPYSEGPPEVEAVAAFTITLLKEKYDNVLEIKSVDTMDQGSLALRHWQLGAA